MELIEPERDKGILEETVKELQSPKEKKEHKKVFCDLKPRLSVFVHKNAGTVFEANNVFLG